MMKKFLKVMAVASSLALLAGCSTFSDMDNPDGSAAKAGANAGAAGNGSQSFGAGQQGQLNGQNMSASEQQKLLTQKTIYFPFNGYSVGSENIQILQAHANYLIAHPNADILVAGNTDPRGSREYNVALGQRRANAVADVLKLDGVPNKQIQSISYGEEKLAMLGNSEQAYRLDRRAELEYQNK